MRHRNLAAHAEGTCVAHPIQVKRPDTAPHVQAGLEATVECEIQNRSVPVEQCRQCARFKNVEVHEGVYVLKCRV